MTSVEKTIHTKQGKKERVHLVHFPHYEVQGEIGNESIQVWLNDKQLQLLLNLANHKQISRLVVPCYLH